nr:zinc ribbon domain-containing protein [uncultured Cetobacterium sp.]
MELALSERTYKCEICKIELDKDINASINIRELGKTLLTY